MFPDNIDGMEPSRISKFIFPLGYRRENRD